MATSGWLKDSLRVSSATRLRGPMRERGTKKRKRGGRERQEEEAIGRKKR